VPASDRQRCCVHRVHNLLAKVPDRERERVRANLLLTAPGGPSSASKLSA
jgi:transposase-like protein